LAEAEEDLMGRRDGHGHAFYAKSHCAALQKGESCEPCEDALERKRMMAAVLPVDALRCVLPKASAGGRSGYEQMGGIKAALNLTMQKTAHRALAEGFISYAQADALATALGRHPVEIWGIAWYGEDTA
jgi:hypothetical protein